MLRLIQFHLNHAASELAYSKTIRHVLEAMDGAAPPRGEIVDQRDYHSLW